MIGPLSEQVVLLTSASSSIGTGTVRALEAAGANVVALDVEDQAQLGDALGRIRAAFGRLDAVVNEAVTLLETALSDTDRAAIRRMVQRNLLLPMLAAHHALPLMRERGRGTIVNVASVRSRAANGGNASYAGALAALGAFTEALRKEGAATGIRASLIVPGDVHPEDVGAAIVTILSQPDRLSVSELVLRPTGQVD